MLVNKKIVVSSEDFKTLPTPVALMFLLASDIPQMTGSMQA